MKIRGIVSLGLLVTLSSCGGKKAASVVNGAKDKAPASADGEVEQKSFNILDQDPSILDDTTLQSFVQTLYNRDQSETRELKILLQMNKDLCQRLQTLRTDCTASAKLVFSAGDEQILGCGSELQGNAAVKPEISIDIQGTGDKKFRLVGNNAYSSSYFSAAEGGPIEFTPDADASRRSPRFMDLSSFKLEAEDKSMPDMEGVSFELSVNERILATQSQFIPPVQSNDASHYRLDPKVILEIQQSAACKIELAEIQEMRDRIIAELGDQATSNTNDTELDDPSTETAGQE